MRFSECLDLAINSIRANKLRSILTMLGIVIGIGSVITISAIGSSTKANIEDQLHNLGDGYVYFSVNWSLADDYSYEEQIFTKDEAEAFKERFGDK